VTARDPSGRFSSDWLGAAMRARMGRAVGVGIVPTPSESPSPPVETAAPEGSFGGGPALIIPEAESFASIVRRRVFGADAAG
jgi:hypothetical protein